MMTVSDLTRQYESTSALLAAEEVLPPVAHYEEWQARQQSRAALTECLAQLGQAVASLQRRAAALPKLAPAAPIHWAQAVLAFPNLAFLEVDTDGLYADADILRISLVDQTGAVLYDQLVQPRRPLSAKIARLTGLAQEQIAQSPRLSDVWPQVYAACTGRYLLSFNLEFDQQQPLTNAQRWDLPLLTFIGECLMLRAQEYYGAGAYPKLADLCERLGQPLPKYPDQDALDRVRGQVYLLRAMAQGISHAPVAHQVPDEAGSGEMGDPFLPDYSDEDE